MTSALLLIPVGSAINRFGPCPVIALGGIAMAGGVAGIGQASMPWQVYCAFLCMGAGWACLSTTAIATILAPWFEKYQGRAMSIASLGASVGGMAGAPVLLFGIGRIGFASTTAVASMVAMVVLLPLAGLVLRHRPQDMGLFPDGLPPDRAIPTVNAPRWTRLKALRTTALRTVMAAFGIGMMGLFPSSFVLTSASIVFGLTVGNVTTLAPIIFRREFGAIFGITSYVIQLTTALGPGFYGLMFDASGGYRSALIMAAALDVVAAVIVLYERRKPMISPA